ncbi:MAG: DUF4956 domain-containing protein [Huintestinicola sp.]
MFNSIFSDGISIWDMLICCVSAIAIGMISALVFINKSRHSAGFALTLSLLPLTVAVIIMIVNGNIGAGVAIAGAFALVRFRSVPGTAREISAIFTAMTSGFAIGMGFVVYAAVFQAVVCILTLIITYTGFGIPRQCEKMLRITIPEDLNYEGMFDDIFEKYKYSFRLERVRTSNMGTLFELTYIICMPEGNVPKSFMDDIRTRNGNLNISVEPIPTSDIL